MPEQGFTEQDSVQPMPSRLTNWLSYLPQSIRKAWFALFWKASPRGVFLFHSLLFSSLFLIAWGCDQTEYYDWVLDFSTKTTVRSGTVAFETWKWAYGTFSLAFSLFSFSFTAIKEVSLSHLFTKSPMGRHLLWLFASTLTLGAAQAFRNSKVPDGVDAFLGDLLFLAYFGATVVVAVLFVKEQFGRIAPTDEYEYCYSKVKWSIEYGLSRSKVLSGRDGLDFAVAEALTHFETMFQVLGSFAQKDMDVHYEGYINGLGWFTSNFVQALHLVEYDKVPYRNRVRFIADKFSDHVLILSQKHHHLEVEHLIHAYRNVLEVSAVYDPLCLVRCGVPIKTMVLVLVQRKERMTLMRSLDMLLGVLRAKPSRDMATAVLYIYVSVLIEAIIAGDKMAINETLYKLKELERHLRTRPISYHGHIDVLYSMLWTGALKSVEHSAYPSTGTFLKTFVSRFSARTARSALEDFVALYATTGRIDPSSVTPSADALKDRQVKQSLVSLNPNFDFIQDSLDYCLEKIIVLWYGQQREMIDNQVRDPNSLAIPRNLQDLHPRYLKYLEIKLKDDPYGLPWAKGKIGEVYIKDLAELWKGSQAAHP